MEPLKTLETGPNPKGKGKAINPVNLHKTAKGQGTLTDEEIAQAFSKAGGVPKVKAGKLSADLSAYKPEYCQSLIDFFDRPPTREVLDTWYHSDGSVKRESMREVPNSPPHLGQWAIQNGFYPSVPYEWARRHSDFNHALTCARSLRKHLVIDNALKGLYNPIFSKLAAANWFNWSEKQDVHHSGEVKSVMVAYHKPEREAPLKIEATEVALIEGPPALSQPSEAEGEDK